jgi:hypothetical protein
VAVAATSRSTTAGCERFERTSTPASEAGFATGPASAHVIESGHNDVGLYRVVRLVLPFDADADGLGALTETHTVGHGLRRESTRLGSDAAVLLFEGERVFVVEPWTRGHCGRSPADFSPVVLEALRSGASPWVGVVASEEDDLAGLAGVQRVTVRPDDFASRRFDDEGALYIVQPDRSPRPVTRRHGPRKHGRT